MIFQSLFCACACGIQFWIYGYSLYQSHATNPFLGNGSLAALHNVLAQPSLANSDIPDLLYACFGFTFVTATAMILAGAMLERGRLWPSMLFLLCWTTFVYYVLAYFEWNPNGWLYKLGVYDFAGMTRVNLVRTMLIALRKWTRAYCFWLLRAGVVHDARSSHQGQQHCGSQAWHSLQTPQPLSDGSGHSGQFKIS
jgi:ammonia channel protein AmtB